MTTRRRSPSARCNAPSSRHTSSAPTATILAGVALWLAGCGEPALPPPNAAVEQRLQAVLDGNTLDVFMPSLDVVTTAVK